HLPALKQAASRGKRMGIVVHSYAIRGKSNQQSKQYPPFKDAVELLEHVHTFGAGGIQTTTSDWTPDLARRLRQRCEALDMFAEGSISAPKSEEDIPRFDKEIQIAKEAGVTVFRTAMGGRRYEDFDSREGWLNLKKRSWQRVQWAEPVVRKHRVHLAVENHKDWQATDLLELMQAISSEFVGVTIDTGNSVSLLEHPSETVRLLSRYGKTTHIKDMGVREYEDGFLLSEVPLGQGFLDLQNIFKQVENRNKDIRFNLEMITREPLKVPCLREKYWATFNDDQAERLAEGLKWIRANAQDNLPGIANRSLDEQIEYEELNNRLSVNFAEEQLGLEG
ncbi:MAG: TIM barrel protein, partial [Verrucomicrobiae bacterium]|nr:TIM barrel protein [Verrucomicrobiae bacterium]